MKIKKLFRSVEVGSPEYVVLHAIWRLSKGNRPSAILFPEYGEPVRNPRKALEIAMDDVRPEIENAYWWVANSQLRHNWPEECPLSELTKLFMGDNDFDPCHVY